MRVIELLLPKHSQGNKALKPKGEEKQKLDMLKQNVKKFADRLTAKDLKPRDRSLLQQKLRQAKEEIKELTERIRESRLNEVFDAPLDYQWIRKSNNACAAIFDVNGKNYKFYAYEEDPSEWFVEFSLIGQDTTAHYGITGTGDSEKVMSTVIAIMQEFLQRYHPQTISFSADEPSRIKLYTHIIDRLLPNWETESEEHSDTTIWKIHAPQAKPVKESVHTVPLTDKQFDELKERLTNHIPAEIAAVILSDVLEDDSLSDQYIALAENDPNHDVRPLVVQWLELNMPDQLYRFLGEQEEEYQKEGLYSPIHGYPIPGSKGQGGSFGDTTNVLGRY